MTDDVLLFFRDHASMLPAYEKLETWILSEIEDVRIRVSKTQISFSNPYGFAFVSFNPCRRAAERPKHWITVSFGLSYQKVSPRIAAATEPYPDRWTHHVMVGSADEIDDELMEWIREAAEFSAGKR